VNVFSVSNPDQHRYDIEERIRPAESVSNYGMGARVRAR